MDGESKANPQVLYLAGTFDVQAFYRIRDLAGAISGSQILVVDFHDVHSCEPFALSQLVALLVRSGGAISLAGLSTQQDRLLRRLGLLATELY
jgi:anti-anti-sigma regulatory factor